MMKKRQIATLALAAVTATSAITISAPLAKSVAAEKTVNLIWYTIGGQPKDLALVQKAINQYTTKKIGATVDMRFVDYGNYNQKMSVIITSGENYDICFSCSWANDYVGNVRKGAFLPLNSYFKTVGKDMYKAINPSFWKGVTVGGKIYAVPANKELPKAPVWTFTKSLVDKYKIDLSKIKSLQSLEPALKLIKSKEPNITPMPLTYQGCPSLLDEFDMPFGNDVPAGIAITDKSTKVINVTASKQFANDVKTLRKYYLAGYINRDAVTNQNDIKNRLVAEGDYQPYAEYVWEKDTKFDLQCVPRFDRYVSTNSTTGSMQAISKNSKHPEKAVEFLNLLNTDKYLRNLVNYGIENVHYKKTSANSIKLLPKSADYSVGYYSLGNQLITYTSDPEPKDKWEKFQAFNNSAKESPLLGFSFNNKKVATEIAAIQNVTKQYYAGLFTGSVDPNKYLPEMQQKLKAAGLDKVISEMQKQINDWKKSN